MQHHQFTLTIMSFIASVTLLYVVFIHVEQVFWISNSVRFTRGTDERCTRGRAGPVHWRGVCGRVKSCGLTPRAHFPRHNRGTRVALAPAVYAPARGRVIHPSPRTLLHLLAPRASALLRSLPQSVSSRERTGGSLPTRWRPVHACKIRSRPGGPTTVHHTETRVGRGAN